MLGCLDDTGRVGRFETAAEFYEYREPYPSSLFDRVAQRLGLNAHSRMLDVGCGPGILAIGFSPYVGPCLAIDIETEMLRAAEIAAAKASARIDFRQISIEHLDSPANSFDFVTIGRAIHWFSREAALQTLERVLGDSATIAVCGTSASTAPENAWVERFREIRRRWSNDYEETRYRPNLDDWFAPSSFRRAGEITASQTYRFSLDQIVKRGLSFSVTAPAVLGDRRAEFEDELGAALEPFVSNGLLTEELTGKATLFARHA